VLQSQIQNIRDNLATKYVGTNGIKKQKLPESQPPTTPASGNSDSSDDERTPSPVIITTTTRGRKRKQATQQYVVPTSNRFSILNEVNDNQLREALRGSQINGKKRNKIMFYSDSYGRDMTLSLSKNNADTSVFGEVRPSAKIRDVLKNCERDCSILGPKDHVVIMGGANDIAKNETKNCIITLKRTLSALTSTNVVVLNIPTRHNLITESIVNKEIRKANMNIYKICKRLKNIKVLNISNISREYHTRHGQHFNRIGKKFITQEIGKIIGNNSKNYTNTIALGFSNQGNV
jgi:hypothetical protein